MKLAFVLENNQTSTTFIGRVENLIDIEAVQEATHNIDGKYYHVSDNSASLFSESDLTDSRQQCVIDWVSEVYDVIDASECEESYLRALIVACHEEDWEASDAMTSLHEINPNACAILPYTLDKKDVDAMYDYITNGGFFDIDALNDDLDLEDLYQMYTKSNGSEMIDMEDFATKFDCKYDHDSWGDFIASDDYILRNVGTSSNEEFHLEEL